MQYLYKPYETIPHTGEVVPIDGTAVLLNEGDQLRSKKQVDYYDMKMRQTQEQRDYGPFTWMLYNCGQNILPNLSQPTLTRLIYASTYLGYDGFLVTDNGRTMTKSMLKRKLGIGEMNFSTFWNELLNNNIAEEKETGRIYLNKEIFLKGELSNSVIKNYDIAKIAANGVRKLYENADSVRFHKQLSYIFMMLPYLNREWNILCKNPYEKEREYIDYMTVAEFCDMVGHDKTHCKKFINSLSQITFDGVHALLYIAMDFTVDKIKIVINPSILWAGTDWEHVKYLDYWFNA